MSLYTSGYQKLKEFFSMREEIEEWKRKNGNDVSYTVKELIQGLHTITLRVILVILLIVVRILQLPMLKMDCLGLG